MVPGTAMVCYPVDEEVSIRTQIIGAISMCLQIAVRLSNTQYHNPSDILGKIEIKNI
jgi:hypothetical protein